MSTGLSLIGSVMVNGVLLGGIYALSGYGLAISFGVMKIFNLAHGDLMILACYLAYTLQGLWGISPLISIFIGPPILFVLGVVLYKALIRRPLSTTPDAVIMITFALSIMLQNACLLIWSPMARGLITGISLKSIPVGSANVPLVYVIDFGAAVALMFGLKFFLSNTWIGLAIRATAQDRSAAELCMVNTEKIYAIALGLSTAISAFAGVLLGLVFPFTPVSGVNLLLISFAVVVLGGLTSMTQCFCGGLIIGLTQVLSGLFLGTGWQSFCLCLAIFVVLLMRRDFS